jgi:hypothetical protein
VKICVLALLISRAAELRTEKTWEEIRRRLRRVRAVQFQSESYLFFQRNDLAPDTSRMLQALGIAAPKRIVSVEKAS